MSMPNIPDLQPTISLTRNEAIDVILASIGFEELGLAHMINAEAESLQFAIGTLETAEGAGTVEEINSINGHARKMLRDVVKNQLLLGMKLEETTELATNTAPCIEEVAGPAGPR